MIFICDRAYFSFQGQIYEQCFGTLMGSPLSPIIANLYMENLEQKIIDACPVGFKPKIWVRYVDDIFEVVKRDKVQELIDNLNSAEETENLKFTVEVESEKKLP